MMNLLEQAQALDAYWSPKIVGQVNNHFVKVAKLKGEFVWHDHADEDEMFLVLQGELTIDFQDRDAVHLGPGDMYVVPKGVQHFPIAPLECCVALFEPVATAHTGDVTDEKTKSIADQQAP